MLVSCWPRTLQLKKVACLRYEICQTVDEREFACYECGGTAALLCIVLMKQ